MNRSWMLAACVLTGCVDVDDADVATSSQDVISSNRLSMNRLSTNRLSTNRLSTNRLSTNRLSTNRLSMNRLSTNGLENTADGRELLSYIVKCAMPFGQQVDVLDDYDVDGDGNRTETLYSFPGSIGLAAEWENGALTLSGQRWISACLLAHVNAFGISVPISVRGPHPALTVSTQERQEYKVQEAAFYGNVFADTNADGLADIVAYGCRGEQRAKDTDNQYLALRVCADTTACGFADTGSCGPFTSVARACGGDSGLWGGYFNCHSTSTTTSTWPASSPAIPEVITVYLLNQ